MGVNLSHDQLSHSRSDRDLVKMPDFVQNFKVKILNIQFCSFVLKFRHAH